MLIHIEQFSLFVAYLVLALVTIVDVPDIGFAWKIE